MSTHIFIRGVRHNLKDLKGVRRGNSFYPDTEGGLGYRVHVDLPRKDGVYRAVISEREAASKRNPFAVPEGGFDPGEWR